MDKLNHIEHAHLAERLIESVGGLARAARIAGLSATSLSTYQNPNEAATMPARVIGALQHAARTTLYSDALTGEVENLGLVVADPLHHACGLMREAADALGVIEAAMSNGEVCVREFADCDRQLSEIEERIDVIRAGLRGKLRVVG